MTAADFWWWFWVVWFVVAGVSFAGIAAVVMVRGVDDLAEEAYEKVQASDREH